MLMRQQPRGSQGSPWEGLTCSSAELHSSLTKYESIYISIFT